LGSAKQDRRHNTEKKGCSVLGLTAVIDAPALHHVGVCTCVACVCVCVY
jgi:hypothetical protein